MVKITKNKQTIDVLIERTKILEHEKRLDKYLCYVLMTELLFGAQQLNGDSKPIECVRSYLDEFQKILAEIKSDSKSDGGSTSTKGNNKKKKEKKTFPKVVV